MANDGETALRKAVRALLLTSDAIKDRDVSYMSPTREAQLPFVDFSFQSNTPSYVLSGVSDRWFKVAIWVVGDNSRGPVDDAISPLKDAIYDLFGGDNFSGAAEALNEFLHEAGWDAMMPVESMGLPMQAFYTGANKDRQRWRSGNQFNVWIQPYSG